MLAWTNLFMLLWTNSRIERLGRWSLTFALLSVGLVALLLPALGDLNCFPRFAAPATWLFVSATIAYLIGCVALVTAWSARGQERLGPRTFFAVHCIATMLGLAPWYPALESVLRATSLSSHGGEYCTPEGLLANEPWLWGKLYEAGGNDEIFRARGWQMLSELRPPIESRGRPKVLPGRVGLGWGKEEGEPVVAAVVAGAPAEHAGIQVGDLIVEVDGAEVHSISEAMTRIPGEPGSLVRIAARRGGKRVLFHLTRKARD